MKRLFLTVLLTSMFFGAFAQVIDPSLMMELNKRGNNDMVRIHIVMKAQIDQNQLARRTSQFKTRIARKDFAIGELKRFSETTQLEVQSYLNEVQKYGMVNEVRSNWLANSISCMASKSVIYDLARRNDIEIIGYDEEKCWIPDGEESEPVSSTREITQNILQVHANEVWNMGYTGQGVVVAVIDSGVNYNHVDVADHLWDGGPEFPHHGYDVWNHDNNPMDDNGHGSHCAGTVCGDGSGSKQTGMAPDATLMCVKCLSASASGTASSIAEGIQWAIDHGCDLFSLSIGVGNSTLSERTMLRRLCVNSLAVGVVGAVAAGNDGNAQYAYPIPNNVRLPGSCPPPYMDADQAANPGELSCSVCVGAVDGNDNSANFSSIGPVTWSNTEFRDYPYNPGIGLIRPDICAPGVNIISLDFETNNGYTSKNGTSMATPCVAGVMCLMLSKNPELTPADLCRILEESAFHKTPNKSNTYGFGRINAYDAMQMVAEQMFEYVSHTVEDAQGNANGKLNPGETVGLSLSLENVSGESIDNAALVLTVEDPYVTVLNNTAAVSAAVDQLVIVNNAFEIAISSDAPANHTVSFTVDVIQNGEAAAVLSFEDQICDYILSIGAVAVLNDGNGNGKLEPGESAVLRLFIDNMGNELAVGLTGVLTSSSQNVTISDNEKTFGTLGTESTGYADYNVTLSASAPATVVLPFNVVLADASGRNTELAFEYKNVCTVTFSLFDTYGDGWGTNKLRVEYSNGIPTEQMTLSSGSSIVYERELPTGTHVKVTFVSSISSEECSYSIAFESGAVVFEGGAENCEFDVNCGGGGIVPEFCNSVSNVSAAVNGSAVILNWSAPAGGAPALYEIYRGTVLVGETTELTFTDDEVFEGRFDYCVHAVYADCESQFVCVEVEVDLGVSEAEFDLNMYPNPAQGNVNIECEGMTAIEVFSVDGKCVVSARAQGASYQLKGLTPGVYAVRVYKGNISMVRKLVMM